MGIALPARDQNWPADFYLDAILLSYVSSAESSKQKFFQFSTLMFFFFSLLYVHSRNRA